MEKKQRQQRLTEIAGTHYPNYAWAEQRLNKVKEQLQATYTIAMSSPSTVLLLKNLGKTVPNKPGQTR